MSKDYYKILGVTKGATEDEIKKAYRKLAHEHHPDRPHGDEKKFKEINEAYQILSNKEKRAQYDNFGQVFEGSGFPGGQGFDPNQMGFEFSFGDFGNLNDVFDAFFEGLGVKQKRRTYNRGGDIEIVQEITLEEAFKPLEKKIKFTVLRVCESCKGMGHDPKAGTSECAHCGGRGEIREARNSFFGSFSQVKQCKECNGSGMIPKKPCASCKSAGRVIGERVVQVDIRQGVQNGQIIKIKGAGEDGSHGAEAGDLYVRIIIRPHSIFRREGDNLYIKKPINVTDILLGKKVEIPTITGEKRALEIPSSINIREPFRASGEGMPHFNMGGRGDLLIEFDLKFPGKLNPKAKKALEDFEKEL